MHCDAAFGFQISIHFKLKVLEGKLKLEQDLQTLFTTPVIYIKTEPNNHNEIDKSISHDFDIHLTFNAE